MSIIRGCKSPGTSGGLRAVRPPPTCPAATRKTPKVGCLAVASVDAGGAKAPGACAVTQGKGFMLSRFVFLGLISPRRLVCPRAALTFSPAGAPYRWCALRRYCRTGFERISDTSSSNGQSGIPTQWSIEKATLSVPQTLRCEHISVGEPLAAGHQPWFRPSGGPGRPSM